MRSFKIYVLLAAAIFSSSIFASDQAEIWSRMYKRAFTPELKYSVMLSISELNDRAMIPLLERILADDIVANINNKRIVSEQKQVDQITMLVVRELGELKATTSASLVYDIVKTTKDPLIRAEAIMSLGNMRAEKYVDDIAFILKNMNLRPLEGKSDDEADAKVAFGAVAALDRFKNIQGYSPVFFASIGWYDQRVRYFADKVLKTIVENPVESLIPIIIEGSVVEKEKAINEVATCKAPGLEKNRAAIAALQIGFDLQPENPKEQFKLIGVRKNAIKILFSNKSSNVGDVDLLTRSVVEGYDFEEKAYGIRTLLQNNTDEAVNSLSSILSQYNQRNSDGVRISRDEQKIVLELIDALGSSGKQSAVAVLTEVQYSGYTNSITRKAKESIKKLSE